MKKSLVLIFALSSLMYGYVNPLPNSNKSIDNGGTLSAIDAYQDGVGAMVIENGRGVDNSAMNGLVFKYGNTAKSNTLNIGDQVLLTGSAEDKLLAGKLFADGMSCSDGNSLSTGETWLNGVCQGGVITSTANIVDIFGDGSGKALYQLNNNQLEISGVYNGSGSGVTYNSGKIGNGAILGSLNIASNPLPKTSTMTFSNWINGQIGSAYLGFGRRSGNVAYNGLYWARIIGGVFAAGRAQISVGASYADHTIGMSGWNHYVTTITPTRLKIYRNTILMTDIPLQAIDITCLNSLSNLYGINEEINQPGYTVNIDQIRYFNKELSPSEINTLYNEQ